MIHSIEHLKRRYLELTTIVSYNFFKHNRAYNKLVNHKGLYYFVYESIFEFPLKGRYYSIASYNPLTNALICHHNMVDTKKEILTKLKEITQ